MIPFPCARRLNRPPIVNRWLLIPAGILLLLSLLLWLVAGPQAGFSPLNHWGSALPADFWAWVTLLGDARVMVALSLPFALYSPALAWRVLLVLVIGGLVTHLMKAGFAMPRPAAVLDMQNFNLMGPELKKGSFPSGHSLTALAASGLAILWLPKGILRALALLLGLLIALSRVMVGAHWPVDVLAGSGLGLLCSWIAHRLAIRLPWGERKLAHRFSLLLLLGTALSLPGYHGGFATIPNSGTFLALLITLASGWAYLSCRGATPSEPSKTP